MAPTRTCLDRPAPPNMPSETAQSILVRSVNWLGDAVMSLPALQRLREARPEARITVLAPEKLADLYAHVPWVDATLLFSPGESPWRLGRRLRPRAFQAALLFPNSPRAALEALLAGIPRRVGYGHLWRRWLLSCPVPRPATFVAMRKRSPRQVRRLLRDPAPPASAPWPLSGHHVHHYLQLATALGATPTAVAPRLVVTDAEMQGVRGRFGIADPPGAVPAPIFGLSAGAEYGPAKRWPWERYAEAAVELHCRTGCRWLLLGGPGDVSTAGQVERALRQRLPAADPPVVYNLAGRTRLGDLCALLRLCSVVLSNDSGPMHVAAAVGARVVVPFGSTSPELTGPGVPGSGQHAPLSARVSCAPCFLRRCPVDLRCLRSIAVETVVRAALDLTPSHRPIQ